MHEPTPHKPKIYHQTIVLSLVSQQELHKQVPSLSHPIGCDVHRQLLINIPTLWRPIISLHPSSHANMYPFHLNHLLNSLPVPISSQLNNHMREQLSKASNREEELKDQLSDYQVKYEQQQQQLASLMMVLQGMQGLATGGASGGGMVSQSG